MDENKKIDVKLFIKNNEDSNKKMLLLSSSINQSEGEKMAEETPYGIKTEIIFLYFVKMRIYLGRS